MHSERIYRALLFVYPKEHRREYGEPMVQLFRDRMSRDGGGLGTLAVWMHTLCDLVCSGSRERIETARTWAVRKNVLGALLLRNYTAKRALTRKQVVVSLLLPALFVLLIGAVASIVSVFFPVSDRLGEIHKSLLFMFGGMVVLNPGLHGLVFRLRNGYDLKNALRAIVLYLPINIFAATVYVHSVWAFSDGKTLLSSVTWFEIMLGSYFGAILCILPVLAHRVGFASQPAPSITTHRAYRQTELAISLGSLFGISM